MRKFTLAAACVLACLALAAGPARGQAGKGDYLGIFTFSGHGGYAIPNTDEYGNTFDWRLAVGYSPLPHLEVDLEVGNFTSQVSHPDENGIPRTTIASGELEVWPICLTGQWRYQVPEYLANIFVGAGVGYYKVNYHMSAKAREFFENSGLPGTPDQDVDDAWGVHIGGGIEYVLTDQVSLALEGRYLFLAPNASGTTALATRFDQSLDLNTWQFTAGIKVSY